MGLSKFGFDEPIWYKRLCARMARDKIQVMLKQF